MNSAATPTFVVIVIQLGLGLAIFYANPRRRTNQCFLLLSIVICGWLGSLCLAFTAKSLALAEFSIRQANATGVLYLAVLNLLRFAISRPAEGWSDLLRRSRIWLIAAAGIVDRPVSRVGAVAVIAVWGLCATLLGVWAYKDLFGR